MPRRVCRWETHKNKEVKGVKEEIDDGVMYSVKQFQKLYYSVYFIGLLFRSGSEHLLLFASRGDELSEQGARSQPLKRGTLLGDALQKII